jgi:hypothetical protein
MKRMMLAIPVALAAILGTLMLPSSIFAQEITNSTASFDSASGVNSPAAVGSDNWEGSVKVPTLMQFLLSEADISADEASEIAEDAVGPDAFAVGSKLVVVKDFLVYQLVVIDNENDPDSGASLVTVDAGNGDVLSIQNAENLPADDLVVLGNFLNDDDDDTRLAELAAMLEAENPGLVCEVDDDELECEEADEVEDEEDVIEDEEIEDDEEFEDEDEDLDDDDDDEV